MSQWVELAHVAELLECSVRTVQRRCKVGELRSRVVPGVGRGGEKIVVDSTCLPKDAQAELIRKRLESVVTITPSLPEEAARAIAPTAASSLLAAKAKPIPTATPPVGGALAASPRTDIRKPASSAHLTSAQRENALARLALLGAVEVAMGVTGRRIPAFNKVSDAIAAGTLAPQLMAVVPVANARNRAECPKVTVGASTLRRWYEQIADIPAADVDARLVALAEIVPTARAFDVMDDDVKRVIAFNRRPNGGNLWNAVREAAPNLTYVEQNKLYHRALRANAKIPVAVKVKGRFTGSSLKARQPYIKRTTDHLTHNDVWTVDGHAMKGKWAHPETGAAFIPEYTSVLDNKTKDIVGWSIGLSETTFGVAEAILMAIRLHGIPGTVYSDNGSGETAKHLTDPTYGLFAQLDIDHRTGRPGNPQGRGNKERSWASEIGDVERANPFYRGPQMDPDTLRMRGKKLDKDLKAALRVGGKTYDEDGNALPQAKNLPTFTSLIEDITASLERYRNRPHRSLPRHPSEPRHLSPAEYSAQLKAEHPENTVMPDMTGWRLMLMPFRTAKVQRGWVTVFKHTYFSQAAYDLAEGEQVKVHFDVTDANKVWLARLDGTFLAEADFQANKNAYFPVSQIEAQRIRRANAQIKRKQDQIDAIATEKAGVIAHITSADNIRRIEETLAQIDADQSEAALEMVADNVAAIHQRPMFRSENDRYTWLFKHRHAWAEVDAEWMKRYVNSDDYRDFRELYEAADLAWPDNEVFKVAAA